MNKKTDVVFRAPPYVVLKLTMHPPPNLFTAEDYFQLFKNKCGCTYQEHYLHINIFNNYNLLKIPQIEPQHHVNDQI